MVDTLGRSLRSKGTYGFTSVRNTFRDIDVDGSGSIEATELRAAFRRQGIVLTDEETAAVMRVFDRNGDGRLNYDEFVSAMLVRFD